MAQQHTHTPGPWHTAPAAHPGDFRICYNDAGNWLAEVYHDDDEVEGRTEADARLIAAAPDLLEAVRFVLEDARKYHGQVSAVTLRILDEVVAKAEPAQ